MCCHDNPGAHCHSVHIVLSIAGTNYTYTVVVSYVWPQSLLSSVMEADASPSSSGEPTTRDTLIFSTADECFKKGPACAIENYTMSLRWNIFTFTYEISRPKVVKIHPCGRCFAQLVLNNQQYHFSLTRVYSCYGLALTFVWFCVSYCYTVTCLPVTLTKTCFFFVLRVPLPLQIFFQNSDNLGQN